MLAGGHRILDAIDAAHGDVFRHRPQLRARDWARRRRARAVSAAPRHRSAALARMTPDEYCQQKAAQSGSSFYYSFLFLPPERRRAITALYAFCREVDDVVDEVDESRRRPHQARLVAQEIAAAFAGTPQHPVAQALQPVVAAFPLPQEHFQTVIDGMAMDLERNRYLDFAELDRLLPSRGRRRRPHVGRDLRRDRGRHARLRPRPRHRVPAHQHHPRRRRGRAARPHLPAAGRAGALRRCRPSSLLRREDSDGLSRADGVSGGAGARMVSRGRSTSCRRRTARRSAPGLIMAAIYRTLLDEIERERVSRARPAHRAHAAAQVLDRVEDRACAT